MSRVSDKIVIIRKARPCFGCSQPISKGDTAHIQTNTDDGRLYSITLCEACQEKVARMNSDDEFGEGDLKGE